MASPAISSACVGTSVSACVLVFLSVFSVLFVCGVFRVSVFWS